MTGAMSKWWWWEWEAYDAKFTRWENTNALEYTIVQRWPEMRGKKCQQTMMTWNGVDWPDCATPKMTCQNIKLGSKSNYSSWGSAIYNGKIYDIESNVLDLEIANINFVFNPTYYSTNLHTNGYEMNARIRAIPPGRAWSTPYLFMNLLRRIYINYPLLM